MEGSLKDFPDLSKILLRSCDVLPSAWNCAFRSGIRVSYHYIWHATGGVASRQSECLLAAAFVALRDHRDCEDLVPLLGVCNTIERLLVRTAKGDTDKRKGGRNFPKDLAILIDNLDAHSS